MPGGNGNTPKPIELPPVNFSWGVAELVSGDRCVLLQIQVPLTAEAAVNIANGLLAQAQGAKASGLILPNLGDTINVNKPPEEPG